MLRSGAFSRSRRADTSASGRCHLVVLLGKVKGMDTVSSHFGQASTCHPAVALNWRSAGIDVFIGEAMTEVQFLVPNSLRRFFRTIPSSCSPYPFLNFSFDRCLRKNAFRVHAKLQRSQLATCIISRCFDIVLEADRLSLRHVYEFDVHGCQGANQSPFESRVLHDIEVKQGYAPRFDWNSPERGWGRPDGL